MSSTYDVRTAATGKDVILNEEAKMPVAHRVMTDAEVETHLLEKINNVFATATLAFKVSPYAGELLLEVRLPGQAFSEAISGQLFAIAGDVEDESGRAIQIVPLFAR